MRIATLAHKLAATGLAWVDRTGRLLVLIDSEGAHSFRLHTADRRRLLEFKSCVESLTGCTLPSGAMGLQFVLSALITESLGVLPGAP